MTESQLRTALLYISTGMKVLNARLLLLLALLMVFALFGFVMWCPTLERIAAASLFGGIVFWPICRLDRRMAPDRAVVAPEES